MLIIRHRAILDSMLLEDVLLFIHYGIRWPSWSRGYIYSVLHDWFLTTLVISVIEMILIHIDRGCYTP